MKFQKLQAAVKFAVCLALTCCALNLNSCAPAESGSLMDFAKVDASYTLEFGGDSGAIVCKCVRRSGKTVMEIVSPERCAGLVVEYDGSSCSLVCEDVSISLSPDAARGVTVIFDLLSRDSGGVLTKSADGSQTTITYSDGAVELNPLPISVSCERRTIKVSEFVILEN